MNTDESINEKLTNFNKAKNIIGEVINYRALRDVMACMMVGCKP